MRGLGVELLGWDRRGTDQGPCGFGAFALAYTVWILLTTMHRSLITDPMAIMGDMRSDDPDAFVRRGFAADVTLGVSAGCIVAALGAVFLCVGQHAFGIGLLSVAPWIVVLDLQDYWRWIGFMQGAPRKSLMNDLLFNTVQALAFGAVFILGVHSVFAVVSAWGLGAAVAAAPTDFISSMCVRPSGEEEHSCGYAGRRAGGWRVSGQPAGAPVSSI